MKIKYLKQLHDILLIVLGIMVIVIVSDNANLFKAIESSMLFPSYLLSMGIIGLKATIRINK